MNNTTVTGVTCRQQNDRGMWYNVGDICSLISPLFSHYICTFCMSVVASSQMFSMANKVPISILRLLTRCYSSRAHGEERAGVQCSSILPLVVWKTFALRLCGSKYLPCDAQQQNVKFLATNCLLQFIGSRLTLGSRQSLFLLWRLAFLQLQFFEIISFLVYNQDDVVEEKGRWPPFFL